LPWNGFGSGILKQTFFFTELGLDFIKATRRVNCFLHYFARSHAIELKNIGKYELDVNGRIQLVLHNGNRKDGSTFTVIRILYSNETVPLDIVTVRSWTAKIRC
jgi:hypothetical protein